MGSPAVTTPLVAGAIRTTHTTYAGFTVRETAGAAATVRIFDNAGAASGTLLETIELTADASDHAHYPGGIRAANGVFVEITGTVEGSLRIA